MHEFYEGLKLWDVQLYVFYASGRFSGGSVSNDANREGGSTKERPSRAWGEAGGAGGRFDLVCSEGLRLSGGTMFKGSVIPGGSAKERPSRAWGEGDGGEGGTHRPELPPHLAATGPS